MKLFLLACVLLASSANAHAGEIFDISGNRIFYTEVGDEIHSTRRLQPFSYTEQILFHEESGRSFRFDEPSEVIVSNGIVFILYHFNKNHFEWIEAAGIKPGKTKTHEHDSAQRIYSKSQTSEYERKVSGSASEEVNFWTTAEQGEIPLLTYEPLHYENGILKDRRGNPVELIKFPVSPADDSNDEIGIYSNEFGEPVYFVKGPLGSDVDGSYGNWCDVVLLHYYFEQNYGPDALEDIVARRGADENRATDSNSVAIDMLNLGYYYESEYTNTFGSNYKMLYFTLVQGEIVILNEDQILQLKNSWLVLNEKTSTSTRPFNFPEGGFHVRKKHAKKRGIEGVKSNTLVIEIKAMPEYESEFQSAIAQ